MTRARPVRRAREAGRLDQALQVDRDVVVAGAQLAYCRDHARVVHHEAPIDHRHEVEDLAVLRADEPVDPRGRKRAPQRRGHRNGVHDVAERAELDDQNAIHNALFT